MHTGPDASHRPRCAADPLGEALHSLRMSGAFYCRSELTAPWGLTLPPLPGYLWFHVVSAGRSRLESGEAEPTHARSAATWRWCPTAAATVLRSEPGSDGARDPRAATASEISRPLRDPAPRRRRRS